VTGSRIHRVVLAVIGVSLIAGCVPAAVTEEGRAVESSYWIFVTVGAVVAAIVFLPLTWALLRYRRPGASRQRPTEAEELPPQTRGHVGLELIWTIGPALTVIALFAITVVTLLKVERFTEDARVVEVRAFRWGWEFRYPDDGVSVAGVTGGPPPVLVVPATERIRFAMSSADVQHAFYVPQFLMKRDVYPGRVTSFEVTIDEPGTYGGQCAEFCGTYHARMPFTVLAVAPAEFQAWLRAQAAAQGAPEHAEGATTP
jgi:cytochrome c oxidase subunit II